MRHPDNGVRSSFSPSGHVAKKPDSALSFVVKDEDQNPIGLLEKWNGGAWIYADSADLIEIN